MGFLEKETKQLEEYLPPLTKHSDFDAFWEESIKFSKEKPLNEMVTPIACPVDWVNAYDIWFDGADGSPVHGLFAYPNQAKGKLPVIMSYHGRGGRGGTIFDHMNYLALGYAVVAIDARDQAGLTRDIYPYKTGGYPLLTRGLGDPYEYHLRWLYLDNLRAVDLAVSRDVIDEDKIIAIGGSQGGASVIVVCALDERVKYGFAYVPSSSNIDKRVEGGNGSFREITDFLKNNPAYSDTAYKTISYFDTMNMADRIKATIISNVGLKDDVCPAIMYYATYNRINSPKEITVYPFGDHGCGRFGKDTEYERLSKIKKEIFNL